MKVSTLLLGSALFVAISACDTAKQQKESSAQSTAEAVTTANAASMEKNGIRLTPFNDSPKYPESQLRVVAPVVGSVAPSGAVAFDYDLSNFQLTKMTGGMHAGDMANSAKGQHIHNIVDNEPYTAHYTTEFTKNIPDGQHVVLSFLSRSYHESLKHRGAYDLRVITVGNAPATPLTFDTKAPNLFYSRPKDVYSGNDTKKVMLDFYLVNTNLSPEGNKVRATINGTEFVLEQWAPYMMEGLPMGQNTVKLELVDDHGTLIPGPYNSVTRTFTLQP
ncbi:hypothetical protein [Hymenobacter crusticola]|uniref:Phosphopeptide-binding protein n=1 Tax=Hymenobacter crusticola TaxID=1770526 RepID=A0A243WCS5_9BACT|nr:hypothetical protein [Hymenobacter crusticola]OUJ73463.1 hypothetical protein BXP70_13705 [Hymenobacter crusticola]